MEFTNRILSNFCSGDEKRPITCRPWSLGDYSYATDGRIIVRVGRVADVPAPVERSIEKTAQRINEWLAKQETVSLVPVPRLEIPKGTSWTCEQCDGRGTEHDCKDCGCECDYCDGTGTQHQKVMVSYRKAFIAADLWRLIQALPEAMIASSPPALDHVAFRFRGGVGIVMPMRKGNSNVEPLIVEAEEKVHA